MLEKGAKLPWFKNKGVRGQGFGHIALHLGAGAWKTSVEGP